MVCKAITFPGITRERFEAIRARLVEQAQGRASIEVAGDTGNASGDGVKVEWCYSEPLQALTLQCVSKPFFVLESVVADKLRSFVEAQ